MLRFRRIVLASLAICCFAGSAAIHDSIQLSRGDLARLVGGQINPVPFSVCGQKLDCDDPSRRSGPPDCAYCEDLGTKVKWCEAGGPVDVCAEKATSSCGGLVECVLKIVNGQRVCDWEDCDFPLGGCPHNDC